MTKISIERDKLIKKIRFFYIIGLIAFVLSLFFPYFQIYCVPGCECVLGNIYLILYWPAFLLGGWEGLTVIVYSYYRLKENSANRSVLLVSLGCILFGVNIFAVLRNFVKTGQCWTIIEVGYYFVIISWIIFFSVALILILYRKNI